MAFSVPQSQDGRGRLTICPIDTQYKGIKNKNENMMRFFITANSSEALLADLLSGFSILISFMTAAP